VELVVAPLGLVVPSSALVVAHRHEHP